jgi:hypothetical protein
VKKMMRIRRSNEKDETGRDGDDQSILRARSILPAVTIHETFARPQLTNNPILKHRAPAHPHLSLHLWTRHAPNVPTSGKHSDRDDGDAQD